MRWCHYPNCPLPLWRSNKLSAIAGLDSCPHLRVLDLGSNRIERIEGLERCPELRELWLGKNRISRIEGLNSCTLLEKLDVQGNRLVTIGPGIAHLQVRAGGAELSSNGVFLHIPVTQALEELYLGHNGLAAIDGLEAGFPALGTLDLTNNAIVRVEGLGPCPALTDLWVSKGGGKDARDFQRSALSLSTLARRWAIIGWPRLTTASLACEPCRLSPSSTSSTARLPVTLNTACASHVSYPALPRLMQRPAAEAPLLGPAPPLIPLLRLPRAADGIRDGKRGLLGTAAIVGLICVRGVRCGALSGFAPADTVAMVRVTTLRTPSSLICHWQQFICSCHNGGSLFRFPCGVTSSHWYNPGATLAVLLHSIVQ